MKQGWVKKKLGEIGKASMCKRIFKNETLVDGEIPFYKIGTFGKEPNAFISKDLYNEYREKYRFPKKGDVLISASGTIGRTVIYDGEPAYFQDSNIVWIDNNEKSVTNMFLFALYKSVNWGESKGTTIKRLYNSNLEEIEIHYPESFEEQKQIVAKLDQCFEAIGKAKANAAKNLENAKELFQSKLNEIFSQKGEGWTEKRLGDICVKITQGPNPKWSGDIPAKDNFVLKTKDFYNDIVLYGKCIGVSESIVNEWKRFVLKDDDIIIALVGVGSIGKSNIFRSQTGKRFIFTRATGLMRTDKEKLHPEYLRYYLLSPSGRELIDKGIGGTTGQLVMKTSYLKGANIKYPSDMQEQKNLIRKAEAVNQYILSVQESYQQKLDSLEELKKSILQKAFEGEL